MPKSVERFSDDIMLCLFDLEPDSGFRSTRSEIIRHQSMNPKSENRFSEKIMLQQKIRSG
ncbi:MAG: hypothetical protein E5V85_06860 [Mesorhizobium sp.]|nr:MAG: hypothetical protein E5V85_06860 [Mesorhizobium sp.]